MNIKKENWVVSKAGPKVYDVNPSLITLGLNRVTHADEAPFVITAFVANYTWNQSNAGAPVVQSEVSGDVVMGAAICEPNQCEVVLVSVRFFCSGPNVVIAPV